MAKAKAIRKTRKKVKIEYVKKCRNCGKFAKKWCYEVWVHERRSKINQVKNILNWTSRKDIRFKDGRKPYRIWYVYEIASKRKYYIVSMEKGKEQNFKGNLRELFIKSKKNLTRLGSFFVRKFRCEKEEAFYKSRKEKEWILIDLFKTHFEECLSLFIFIGGNYV